MQDLNIYKSINKILASEYYDDKVYTISELKEIFNITLSNLKEISNCFYAIVTEEKEIFLVFTITKRANLPVTIHIKLEDENEQKKNK